MDPTTASAEFQRGNLSTPKPCVIVAACRTIRNAVDLTGDLSGCHPGLRAWDADWEDARDDLAPGVTAADCPSRRCKGPAVEDHRAGFVPPSELDPSGQNIVRHPEDATACGVA